MGNLPQIGQPVRIPITLSTPEYLMDHHYQGKPVLPAVAAMEALARVVKEKYPGIRVDHLTDAGFEKFLFMAAEADRLDAIVELETLENGRMNATLLTRTKSPKAAFTRTKYHVRLNFNPSTPPEYLWPQDRAASIEGICITVPPEKIYQDLVPFGPTFRNIQAPLLISPDGALAQIKTPPHLCHEHRSQSLLGSGYPLDAAFHAACVWAQHYTGIVAFPVAVDRRTIIKPTGPEQTYIGRIIPKTISDGLLIFDMLLLDEDGLVCEAAEGVRMRDVSGGRLHPPDWITVKGQSDPLEDLRKVCRDMAIFELDAVAGFAQTALTSLEKQRHEKMGARRRKSFLAARMALKKLYRREQGDDGTTPADQIETVRKNSPLPSAGPEYSSGVKYCSVSHDRRFAIAVVASQAVGVDVEVISAKALKADRIFMSTAEQKRVAQTPMADTSAAVRIWSAKEAVAKAMGMNLADAWTRAQVVAVGEKKSKVKVDGRTWTAHHATVDEHLFTLVVDDTR